MDNKFTITQLLNRFPTNDSCLEHIKNLRWGEIITCPKCKRESNFYKMKGRPAYACQFCGYHLYPLARTIFDKSSTPLTLWFYAIYLIAQTRSGISAKQLQRELGVTYKTAWRMFKQIRLLFSSDSGDSLDGIVEVDETFVGGKAKNRMKEWHQDIDKKEVLMGMVKREGKVYIKHIPNAGKWTLLEQIKANISPKAIIFTDEWAGYTQLKYQGYDHGVVTHYTGEYVKGEVHTQNIENVWSHLKRGIFGVYRCVSAKYLQSYADEFAFRYSNRLAGGKMFDLILGQVPNVRFLRA